MVSKPKNNYTPEQEQAIYETGHDILVSASAGSGKTMVLVERIIQLVLNGANITDLLVVTFTKAAAKEMKERIQSKIQSEINTLPADSPQKHHLIKQIPLIGQANISTIHSFCTKVIKKYYYLVDMDPVFRMLTDETEIEMIKEDILDECIELKLEDENPAFYNLLQMHAGSSNLNKFKNLVLSIYQFAMAKPDYLNWMQDLGQAYEVDRLVDLDIYQNEIKPDILANFEQIILMYDEILSRVEGIDLMIDYQNIFTNLKQEMLSLQHFIIADDLDEFYSHAKNFKFKNKPSLPTEIKQDPDYIQMDSEVKALNDSLKDVFRDEIVGNYFAVAPDEQIDFIHKLAPLIDSLVSLLLDFHQGFTRKKQEMQALDFNDLEHKTLEILRHDSQVAQAFYQESFQEVLIDEYQDINVLQEEILSSVARQNPGNRFMVGDVKQSIYGFRLAAPQLFINKYDDFAKSDHASRIVLQKNFRSRDSVLDFINYLFNQIMDSELGDVTYDEAAQLNVGNLNFPSDEGELESKQTELLFFETESEQEPDSDTELENEDLIRENAQGEYRMVAQKIDSLVQSGYSIYDKKLGQNRPVQYRDIAILTPTKNNNLLINDELSTLNIPVFINNTENYFQRTEIKTMMSLLKIIDNPLQDIPLVAVLRSAIVGLTEPELAKIRLINKTDLYYQALMNYAQSDARQIDQALQVKVKDFLDQLEGWRQYAKFNSLVDLIWLLYKETNYLEYVGGLTSGQQRQRNLHALYERAARYEESSFRGLFQFIRFIERMQNKEKDLAEPTTITDDENAVRVMTIHASKGLEFPIVFLTNTSKRFNISDAQGDFSVDSDEGLGMDYIDREAFVKYPTWLNKGIQAKRKKQLVSEEMRVLYVALTRAEQKLIITGQTKIMDKEISEWKKVQNHTETILPLKERMNPQGGFINWIGKSLIRHPLSKDWRDTSDSKALKFQDVGFAVHFVSEDDLLNYSPEVSPENDKEESLDISTQMDLFEQSESDSDSDQAVRAILENLNYDYPFQDARQTTSFQSVSEIKRLFEEPEDERLVRINISDDGMSANRFVTDELDDPQFIKKQYASTVTPRQIGSATHLLLQGLNMNEAVTHDRIQAHIQDLVDQSIVKENVARKIDVDAIYNLFDSEFGELILTHAKDLRREVPFSLLIEASQLFNMAKDPSDNVLIHGIVDGFIHHGNEIILFDYKTDRVSHLENPNQVLIDRYKGQLGLYKMALETIYKDSTVSHVYIVSTDLVKAIEL